MNKLYRSNNSSLGGVCGGIGEYFNIDPTFIRIITFGLIFTPFPTILVYLLLWISIPLEKV
jgi:phage shock protein C